MNERSENRHDRESGFTLIEISISMVLLITILYVVNSTLFAGKKAQSTNSVVMDFTDKLRIAAGRITDDLRAASRTGEDRDVDGTLSPSEDLNKNGRLESDWAVTANSITFNRLMADGTYSMPITYRFAGGRLERVATTPDGSEVATTLTTDVTNFTVSETLPRVTFQMTISKRLEGRLLSRSSSFTVIPRN